MFYTRYLRAFLVFLGFLGIVVYCLVPAPTTTERLLPQGTLATERPYAVDDSSRGGSSRAYKSVSDSLYIFDCVLGSGKSAPAFCAFGWDLEPTGHRNWSQMDSLILEIKTTGMNQVILKLLTKDPDHPKILRHLIKELDTDSGWKRIAIPMDHLYTPDYWFKDNGIASLRGTSHLEAVERIEFAPGWDAPRSQPLGIQIRHIELIGVSNFYFGLLVVWELVLIIIALGVRTPSSGSRP